jgi:hypothetical protein
VLEALLLHLLFPPSPPPYLHMKVPLDHTNHPASSPTPLSPPLFFISTKGNRRGETPSPPPPPRRCPTISSSPTLT